MHDDLRGKTVFITGGSGGLGRQLIEDFASAGSDLIVHARRFSEEFSSWLETVRMRHGSSITTVEFDLADGAAIQSSLRELSIGTGIDVLINNAGVAHGGLTQMTTLDEVRSVFEINYFSQVQVTQWVVRRMVRKKSGSIVNISSIAGLDSKAGNVAYGASKAAMIAFTRTLSSELASSGIRVNCVAPGLIDTEMAKLMESKAEKVMIEESAMKRTADPSEVSSAVMFLASSESSFVNGQTLRVDGGRS